MKLNLIPVIKRSINNFQMRKIFGLEYMQCSLEQTVKFYFDTFLGQFRSSNTCINKFEDKIKKLIYDELDSFEFNKFLCQTKKNKYTFGVKKMHSELGNLTHDWTIDWEWIIHHITLDYVNTGKALFYLDNFHSDKIQVYKYMPENYYEFAQKLYLRNLIMKQPRIFDLMEIIQNGHGLKSEIKNFVPVVGVTLWKGFNTNYWDLTELRIIPKDYIWDNITKRFELSKNFERKVERRSKIKITIGVKTFYV